MGGFKGFKDLGFKGLGFKVLSLGFGFRVSGSGYMGII